MLTALNARQRENRNLIDRPPASMHHAGMENEIKQIRMALGWPQARLAEALGVNQSTVCNWEHRAVAPTLAVIAARAVRDQQPKRRRRQRGHSRT
jgi:DNA-binding transcriptional regulator YiaG